jgi:hypothetical protein
MIYFDRFDIAEAYYLALTHCHGGQTSPTYARLCHMGNYFKPSMGLCVESLTDNGLEIYERACERFLKAD